MGIVVPTLDALFVDGVLSKVTSDCLADCLTQWWEAVRARCDAVSTLVIHRDNGPDNHSRRTHCMRRMVDFVYHYRLHVRLASYPPSHSQDNPMERCWGMRENHWNGALLDSIETVVAYARTMTWKSKHPTVDLVTTVYKTGVKLTKEAMNQVEKQLQRLPSLHQWFVDIYPLPHAWDT